jgi:hypothetical protein
MQRLTNVTISLHAMRDKLTILIKKEFPPFSSNMYIFHDAHFWELVKDHGLKMTAPTLQYNDDNGKKVGDMLVEDHELFMWACRNNLPDVLLLALDYRRGKIEPLDEILLYDPLRLTSFWETYRELADFDFKTSQGNCILTSKLPAQLKKKLDAYIHAARKVVPCENGDTENEDEDSLTEEDESDEEDCHDDDDETHTGNEHSEFDDDEIDGSDLDGFIVDSSEEEESGEDEDEEESDEDEDEDEEESDEDEDEDKEESEKVERIVKRSRRL